jgi:uncharacterized repeat protein (TIGR01451 family)
MTHTPTFQKNLSLTGICLLILFLLPFQPLFAQGWEKTFGGSENEDQANTVIQTIDQGYLMVGFSQSFPDGSDNDIDIYVVKTDIDGTLVWEKTYDPGTKEFGSAAVQTEDLGFVIASRVSLDLLSTTFQPHLLKITDEGKEEWSYIYDYGDAIDIRILDLAQAPDGSFLMAGHARYEAEEERIFLLKTDEQGTELWRKSFDSEAGGSALAIVPYNDGFVIAGREDSGIPPPAGFGSDAVIMYVDADGNLIWKDVSPSAYDDYFNDVIITQDNNIVASGKANLDVLIKKFNEAGAVLWENTYDVSQGNEDEAFSIAEVKADSSLVAAGFIEVDASNINFLLMKLDADGQMAWAKSSGDVVNTDFATSVVATNQGGFIFTGYKGQTLNFANDVSLTLTDGNGDIYTSYISGKVFYDQDGACDFDPGEQPFNDWLVRVKGTEETYFGSSDENGNFLILVDTGTYVVEAIPANSNWESCSPNGVNIIIDNFYDTTAVNFPMTATILDCPFMEVDVSTPFLAPCTDIVYTVAYANDGTADAIDAYVELIAGDSITFTGASLPFTQNGPVYTFQLGDVPFNTDGQFTIDAELACDGIAQGQAGMVSAKIFPDTLCTPPDPDWDGSSIKVSGVCLTSTDTVQFTLSNIADVGMTQEKTFFIVEDDLVIFLEQYQLPAESEIVQLVETDGATVRMIAEQSESHPGNSFPTAAVEGCVEDGGAYSTGYITDWPEDDLDPSVSVHISEFMDAEPEVVSLVGYPSGYQDTFIGANTDITYRFAFRNIGTDTVQRVVIRDTISAHLDLSTLVAGASSHPYEMEVYRNGVIKITFEDIQLPNDASAMDPNSYGFVEFKIGQKAGNPDNTVIENSAYVIYDYYAPLQTNTVQHVIGARTTDSLIYIVPTSLKNPPEWAPEFTIEVYPNPMSEYLILEIEGWDISEPLELSILNAQGQLIKRDVFRDNQYTLPRAGLSAGSYFYALKARGKLVGGGTIIVR